MSAERRPCSLCGAEAGRVCTQRLLGKHEVDYFLCPTCELLQTESPHWLDEAYSHAISQLDTGAVQRNQLVGRLTEVLVRILGIGPDEPCLDYGGGHGVFVRMMRDAGLDFRWFDKYAENHFARGFEGELDKPYTLVTAFEVLEHLADVRRDLDALFAAQPAYVLVGTLLHAGHQPGWWYYLLESGQHVVFYAPRTLRWIAAHYGYQVIVGPEYSLFARTELGRVRELIASQLLQRPAISHLAQLARRLKPYPSRVQDDHEALRRISRP